MSVDDYMPYVSKDAATSDTPGYMVEIAQQVFARQHISLILEYNPYVRALVLGKEGKIDGMFGVGYPDPAYHAPYGTHGVDRVCLFGRENGGPVIDDLKHNVVGLTKGYDVSSIPSFADISAQLVKYNNLIWLTGENNVPRFIEMLSTGRIDGFIDRDYVVSWYSKAKHNLELEKKYCSEPRKSYILFFQNSPNAEYYSRMINEGIGELRTDGTLKQILARYGLSDWESVQL